LTTSQERRDEVDILRLVFTLASWWLEILLAGLLVAVVAVSAYIAWTMLRVSVYAASADVAILRTVSDVSFDERFTTQTEEVVGTALVSRRNALLSLANSTALGQEVIDRLGELLPEELQDPTELAKSVTTEMAISASVRGDSDLIRITATSEWPDISAAVATEWARVYVETVNRVYAQAPDELIASIERELADADVKYTAAQAALEEALAQSTAEELARQIEDAEASLRALRAARQSLFDSTIDYAVKSRNQIVSVLVDQQTANLTAPYAQEQAFRRSIVVSYLDALYGGQRSVVSEQQRRASEHLRNLSNDWLQVEQALRGANALREQVAAYPDGTVPGSAELVLALLKLQTLTQALDVETNAALLTGATARTVQLEDTALVMQPNIFDFKSTPLQIQLDDESSVTREGLLVDIDALVDALTAYSGVLEEQIAAKNEQMRVGGGYESLEFVTPVDSSLVAVLTEGSESLFSQSLLSLNKVVTSTSELEIGIDVLGADISELATSAADDPALAVAIAELEAEIRRLRREVEVQKDITYRLANKRDLARDAFTAVRSKIAEQTLARAAAGSEVRFAAPAVVPSEPLSAGSPLLVALVGSVVGVILGMGYVLIAVWNGRKPYLTRRQLRATGAKS